MSEVIKTAWAGVFCNQELICIETYSGYRSGQLDPKGKRHLLSPDASDENLGHSLADALASSRFVLAAPRAGSEYPPEVGFDKDLYDYDQISARYQLWIQGLMDDYGYKTKRALFKDMKNCNVKMNDEIIVLSPSKHEKLEMWGRSKGDGIEDVILPRPCANTELGAALRLAMSRCIA